MPQPRMTKLQLALAALTGLLSPLCFPDFDLGWLAWLVLLPLHLALLAFPETGPRRSFWLGWLAGTVGSVGIMAWVVTAMHLYGKVPVAISYAVMLLLATYLGLYVAVYAWGLAWLRRSLPHLALLGAPFLWVALELLRTHLLSGLPWALLGYSQYRWLPVIQIADHTGVYGISFLLVLANVALADAAVWLAGRLRGQAAHPFPWIVPAAAVAGLAVTVWYGQDRLAGQPASSDRTVGIGLVQANIDQAHKWDEAYRRETLDRYARLTRQAAAGSDLIVWPEAATPFLFEREPRYREEVASLVRAQGAPLLFGSPALRYHRDGRIFLLNSAFLHATDGTILGRYDKQHLVPFGEYIPLHSSVLFFLDKLVEGIGDFEAGTVATILEAPGREAHQPGQARGPVPKFGVVICYEVIFPNLVREFAERGAEFMVTITNDAWFGRSAAPYQHFGMVVLRAVENRRAFARAANTGVSGFIDPQGRIIQATPIFEEAAVTGRIPLDQTVTFYTRYGDAFAYACAIITGLLAVAASRRRGQGARG
ncbi:MAG: apolipoprotein N-acyltransferase [Nitrospirota bacterium]